MSLKGLETTHPEIEGIEENKQIELQFEELTCWIFIAEREICDLNREM